MFTDIHCHILPFLDDGAKDWDETEAMLRQAAEQDVSRIIATTHASPQWKPFPLEKYKETLTQANQLAAKMRVPLVILPGSEIMYTEDIVERQLIDGKIPTLAESNHVLIEFMPDEKYARIEAAVSRLRGAGYVPIIAHVERYEQIARDPKTLHELRNLGAQIQVNFGVFTRRAGFFFGRFLKHIIANNLIDFMGTDAHSAVGRKVNRSEARTLIVKKYGETALDFENRGIWF